VPALVVVIAIQVLCAAFFVGNIILSVLGLPPIGWQIYELIEIGAGLGLVLGIIMGIVAVRRSLARTRAVEQQLRAASGAFMELLEERFAEWGLTAAERDVALFAIKGLSTGEIAGLRGTSEGTVKAQTNAIYRKAGVSGRPQLLSVFIEDLMSGPVTTISARKNAQDGVTSQNPVL
jgi:DNA-binding CsgD family transcriptional regulator